MQMRYNDLQFIKKCETGDIERIVEQHQLPAPAAAAAIRRFGCWARVCALNGRAMYRLKR